MSGNDYFNIFLTEFVNGLINESSRNHADISYNIFNRPSRNPVDLSYNRHEPIRQPAPALSPIRQPAPAPSPIRQSTINPIRDPSPSRNELINRLWLRYNDNITQYQRIMENQVFPNIPSDNDYSNIFNIYNTNIYNYQYNFHNIINHLSSEENSNIRNELSPEEIIDEHINNINESPTTPTEPSSRTNRLYDNYIQSVNNEPENMYGYYNYIYRDGQRIYQYIQGTYDIPDEVNNNAITNSQINAATQLVPYDLSMNNTSCPISYVEFSEGDTVCQIKHCKHIFKQPSLLIWLQDYSSCCPVCRYDLRTYVNPSSSERTDSDNNNNNNNTNYVG